VADFSDHIDVLLKSEGGPKITDDPNDRGGVTKYGISQRAFPDLEIRDLTEDMAKAIYHREYWEPLRLDELDDEYGDGLDERAEYAYFLVRNVFLFGVNAGVGRAAKFLQFAFNCIRKQTDEPLAEDGAIGPKTLKAVNAYIAHGYGQALHLAFIATMVAHYNNIVKNNPSQRRFIRGWLNRIYS
jgi:lysozyme family protein